jgi:hypothetical protein
MTEKSSILVVNVEGMNSLMAVLEEQAYVTRLSSGMEALSNVRARAYNENFVYDGIIVDGLTSDLTGPQTLAAMGGYLGPDPSLYVTRFLFKDEHNGYDDAKLNPLHDADVLEAARKAFEKPIHQFTIDYLNYRRGGMRAKILLGSPREYESIMRGMGVQFLPEAQPDAGGGHALTEMIISALEESWIINLDLVADQESEDSDLYLGYL